MPFDPAFPPTDALLVSAEFRAQFQALKALIDAVPAGPLLLIQRKIGTVQTLFAGLPLDPVEFTTAPFPPLGAGGAVAGGTFTASVPGVFRFSYRLIFDPMASISPAPVRFAGAGTASGVGDPLFAGMVDGAALATGSHSGVISFSETLALGSGETYRLTALQLSATQMDITGGEVVIERLG
jgi:hypothetical protein